MDKFQDKEWCEIYIQLENNIVDLTQEEIKEVINYISDLKSKCVKTRQS